MQLTKRPENSTFRRSNKGERTTIARWSFLAQRANVCRHAHKAQRNSGVALTLQLSRAGK
jgi:hypothetical protein